MAKKYLVIKFQNSYILALRKQIQKKKIIKMSRQVYVFTVNPEKARKNLIKEIQNDTKYQTSFKDYIVKYNFGLLEFEKSNYESITHKIVNDFYAINRYELAAIFYWFFNDFNTNLSDSENNYYEREIDFYNMLKELGIELVCELDQKDKCWVFMYQLGEYEALNKLGLYSDDDNWKDYEMNNEQFKEYLDYLLLLLCKIEIEQDPENREVQNLLNEFKANDKLHKMADYSLIEVREENEAENILESENPDHRRSYQRTYYEVAEMMIYFAKELQGKIKDYNGKILIIDSQ